MDKYAYILEDNDGRKYEVFLSEKERMKYKVKDRSGRDAYNSNLFFKPAHLSADFVVDTTSSKVE